MRLTPKNWGEFQHYKDRAPAWIKLHKRLLDDYDYQCLPVASRALAPMLWLIASENSDGVIDAEPNKLAFRLRMSEPDLLDALKPLIDGGFFSCDSAPLADCKHDSIPEKEDIEKRDIEKRENSLSAEADDDDSENVFRETIAVALNAYRDAIKTTNIPRPNGTTRQRALIATRLRSHGLEDWRTVCDKIRGSPFLHGDDWTGATLDWICKLANFEKTLEGNYDPTDKNRNGRIGGSKYDSFRSRGATAGNMDDLQQGPVYAEDGDCSGGEPVSHLRLASGR